MLQQASDVDIGRGREEIIIVNKEIKVHKKIWTNEGIHNLRISKKEIILIGLNLTVLSRKENYSGGQKDVKGHIVKGADSPT